MARSAWLGLAMAVAIPIGVLLTACGGEASRSSSDQEFAVWAADVVNWAEDMTSASVELNQLTQDQTFTRRLLEGEASARAEFDASLSTISDCHMTFPTAPEGSAEADRLEGIIVESACPLYELGATQLAEGIDTLNEYSTEAAGYGWDAADSLLDQVLQGIEKCLKDPASC